METPTSTRERLVAAMADQLARRGLHGVGLSELLAQAKAPKGVMYHHFPGGKQALAVAAIEQIAQRIGDSLDHLLRKEPDPVAALQIWIQAAQRRLDTSGFEHGCPLATVALESTAQDTELRAALASAFGTLRRRMADALVRSGLADPMAHGLASLMVATYEGGLIQARVAGSSAPMAQATQALLALLKAYTRPGDRT